MMRISIIVPIYNVEKYLRRCIENLINQTYKNIEIILIDDGSSDNCHAICDEYQKIDNRIKVIHKINEGLSVARNVGMQIATGEYILFVDSDDYIELNTCSKFENVLNNIKPEIIVGNAIKVENNIKKLIKHTSENFKIISGKEYLKKELKNNSMEMIVWLNLYKKEFLLNNNLFFKKGFLHEDEEFTPRVFLKAKTVLPVDIVFYNYLIRESSIMTSKNKIKNLEHIHKICEELDLIYNALDDTKLKKLLKDSLFNKYLGKLQEVYVKDNENFKLELVDKRLLKNKAYSKINKLRFFILLLNPLLYFYLYSLYFKRKNSL